MEANIKETIYKELGIDIDQRTRKREVIEARALYFYVVRKVYSKRTLHSIASDFEMNHASVVHSLKNFEMYETLNPKIRDCKNLILSLLGYDPEDGMTEEDKFKKRIQELENKLSQPRYDIQIIENLNNLLELTKGTEQYDLITLRLEAFYSMNKNIRL